MKRDSLLGILAGLTATAIWGGMYVVSKAVMAIIPPFSLIVLRLVLGILTLAVIVLVRKNWKVTAKQFWGIFAVGLIGYGVSLGFQFVGTNLSTAANGSLVTSATPAFVLLFAAIILKEKITPRRLLALVVASLGVLAVIDPRTAQLSSQLFWGNLSLVAAALTWALYSVLVRRVTRNVDVLSTSLIAFAGGLPVCLPLGAWEAATRGYGPIGWGVVAGVLFLGIISTALAMYLWNTAFAKLEAGVASLTFFAQPVVGTVLGAIFLGDNINPLFIVGGIFIGIGLIISSKE
ncbi:MAG: DMT family transporter [Chloroflexi bacterium]|jgi:drug/metabolite transporter (DMT)-like permease|nr:DMT family transporter [Chloroflexota bacterium]